MSDRIVVFNHGRIEQIGTPSDVYERPSTRFVAGFLGVSNLIELTAIASGARDGEMVSIRPERINLQSTGYRTSAEEVALEGEIDEVAYLGPNTVYFVQTKAGPRLSVTILNQELPAQGERFASGDRVLAVWRKSQAVQISA